MRELETSLPARIDPNSQQVDRASARASAARLKLDRMPWMIVGAVLLLTYVPTLWSLSKSLWRSEEHVHGPIVLAVSAWLLWDRFNSIGAEARGEEPAPVGWMLLVAAMLTFALGRSQSIIVFEMGSMIVVLAATLLLLRGPSTLKSVWFPLFFMAFAIPLPEPLVNLITGPMKIAVSSTAEHLLYWAGYPIARTGVVLQIGPYQLLVADACAGLQTLFTLEALGLLYLNLVQHASLVRNFVLATLIVPISFAANVIRVGVLTLVTYYFGDEAGQGFVHGFAGIVLFSSGLVLIMFVDSLIRYSIRFAQANRAKVLMP